MNAKFDAGAAIPELTLPKAGGGTVKLGGAREGWQLVVVYRGKHCPLCKKYLTGLNELMPGFVAAKTEIVAVSGDPKDKAEAFFGEIGAKFPVAFDLSVADMRRLGLYISNPRSPQETDRQFPEPALFVLNPQGQAQIIDISNAPFARPDLGAILNGIKLIQERAYPIRGTA